MTPPRNVDIEKLRLVREVAAVMVDVRLSDLNLVLHELGLTELSSDEWYGDRNGNWEPDDEDRREMAMRAIRDLGLGQLEGLGSATHQLFDSAAITPAARVEPSALSLFASHLTTQRSVVRQVAEALERWGVTMFVAHADIAPDEEWHAAIESHLRSADAGVVFMFAGFGGSQWCDQEVGWLLGREVPIRTLMFAHQNPYGPLGKRQAYEVPESATAHDLAKVLLDWLSLQPSIRGAFQASLVQALSRSNTFDWTNTVWAYLSRTTSLTEGQVASIASAVRDNDQVYGGQCRVPGPDYKKGFPEVIIPFLLKQPGYSANEELIREVAEARELMHLLPANPVTPVAPTSNSPWGQANSEPWNGPTPF